MIQLFSEHVLHASGWTHHYLWLLAASCPPCAIDTTSVFLQTRRVVSRMSKSPEVTHNLGEGVGFDLGRTDSRAHTHPVYSLYGHGDKGHTPRGMALGWQNPVKPPSWDPLWPGFSDS